MGRMISRSPVEGLLPPSTVVVGKTDRSKRWGERIDMAGIVDLEEAENRLIKRALTLLDAAFAKEMRRGYPGTRALVALGLDVVRDDPDAVKGLVLLALRREAWTAQAATHPTAVDREEARERAIRETAENRGHQTSLFDDPTDS